MKLTENLALKTAAVFLVFFASVGFIVGAAAGVYANEMGLFASDGGPDGFFDTLGYETTISEYADSVFYYLLDEPAFADNLARGVGPYTEYQSNIRFEITVLSSGASISNSADADWDSYIESASFRRYFYYLADFDENDFPSVAARADSLEAAQARGEEVIIVDIGVPYKLHQFGGLYYQMLLYGYIGGGRQFVWLWTAILSALAIAVATVYLCCGAGHVKGKEGITPNVIDRMPYDIYLVVMGTVFCFGVMFLLMLAEIAMNESNIRVYCLIGFLLLFGLLSLCLLSFILTTAARLKMGGFLKNTLCYKLVRLFWRGTKGFFLWLGRAFRTIALEWRVFILTAGFLWASFFCAVIAADRGSGGVILLLFAFYAVTVYAACSISKAFKQIIKGSRAIAEGDVDYKINTVSMRGELKGLAEDLNSIAGGMGKAVERQIKSERLKTELITNVSHDIKTPLTSIINYVDLLKKEPLEGKAIEYADILEKHANRLKKLTLDLIEASKAATGNITPELVPVNLCELVNQAVGEYSERLEDGNITPVVDMPEDARYIMADGKLFWRVIDNLLGNAAKYSQPGTRLYISVTDRGGQVALDMKNISRERLNIAPDELTERFVRGDSSRHTEGSGLGLNIAKSLTELQKGSFSIEIDGDLFKVEVAFDSIFISSQEGETA